MQLPAALALTVLSAATMSAQIDRITGRAFATRSEVIAQHGMVCTSQPLATQIGIDVLKAVARRSTPPSRPTPRLA